MSKESSELLANLQKAWEEAQHQLIKLRKQVEERAALENFWSEKVQVDQKRQKALSDLGAAVYEDIQQGAIAPPKRWEGLLQRVAEVMQKAQEQQQKLSELLEEGQALAAGQAKESKKTL